MKRLLFVGSNASASWRIRGEQLGGALGAALANRSDQLAECKKADLAILVKRPHQNAIERLRAADVPIVWDVVDAWPQPIGNWWKKDLCVKWLGDEIKRIKPTALVVNTEVMKEDCGKFGLPTLVLPHHAKPDLLRPKEMRLQIKWVGYEGQHHYLGRWEHILNEACRPKGWRFTSDPSSVRDMDIIIAVREQDGYAAKNWKSNVKLANAQAVGVPCVLNRECGYLENASGAELWADTAPEMESALATLFAENGARQERADRLYAATPRLDAIAAKYRAWLESL